MIDKANASKVAAPYAEALLDLAKRNKSLDETNQDINIISQFVSSSKDLERFLANPVVTKESKKTVLKDLLGEQVSAPTLKFLNLLVEKDRIECLGAISQLYTILSSKEASNEVAEVTSVTQLSAEQQAKLKSNLKQLRGTSNIELVLKVDPTLLGGFVVQIGSSVLDFSLAGALKKMQNHFQSVTL